MNKRANPLNIHSPRPSAKRARASSALSTSLPIVIPSTSDVSLARPDSTRLSPFTLPNFDNQTSPRVQTLDTNQLKPDDSSSQSGLSSGSRGTHSPDLWVKVTAQIAQRTFALVTMITEIKVHPIHPSCKNLRRDKAREAFSQTILYLIATWEICGTWLGSWVVNSKFGRICVIECSESNKFDNIVAVEAPKELVNKLPSILCSDLLESGLNLFDILPHDIFKGYKHNGLPQVDENGMKDFDGAAVNTITSFFVTAIELAANIPFGQPLKRLPGPSPSFKEYCQAIFDQCVHLQPNNKDFEQFEQTIGASDFASERLPFAQSTDSKSSPQEGDGCQGKEGDNGDNDQPGTPRYMESAQMGKDIWRRAEGMPEFDNNSVQEHILPCTLPGFTGARSAKQPTDTADYPSSKATSTTSEFISRWLTAVQDSHADKIKSADSEDQVVEDIPEVRPAWLDTVRIVFVSPDTMTEMIERRCEVTA
ncbi:hypothetical protein BDY19DRAFT_355518 [Irpex rosettiformis]|uniref:Uncharacterized protein n=1 Tax=Irpex rosettiformis TaxID=378272 RepID=A0ACB8TW84_9APHY|nr:hypothetical protein BDY19DRAFT_355518 [Irpex rosettiformis]